MNKKLLALPVVGVLLGLGGFSAWANSRRPPSRNTVASVVDQSKDVVNNTKALTDGGVDTTTDKATSAVGQAKDLADQTLAGSNTIDPAVVDGSADLAAGTLIAVGQTITKTFNTTTGALTTVTQVVDGATTTVNQTVDQTVAGTKELLDNLTTGCTGGFGGSSSPLGASRPARQRLRSPRSKTGGFGGSSRIGRK